MAFLLLHLVASGVSLWASWMLFAVAHMFGNGTESMASDQIHRQLEAKARIERGANWFGGASQVFRSKLLHVRWRQLEWRHHLCVFRL